MHIRKATLKDLPAIARLIRQAKELQMPSGHALVPSYNRAMIKGGIVLVAEFEGRFAGFLLAEADRKTRCSYLTYIAISPKYRGLGLGSRLLEAYQKECRKRGIRLITVHTYAWNKKSLSFYLKRGFYAGEPEIQFYKKLRP